VFAVASSSVAVRILPPIGRGAGVAQVIVGATAIAFTVNVTDITTGEVQSVVSVGVKVAVRVWFPGVVSTVPNGGL
jgi:hypothetical protein